MKLTFDPTQTGTSRILRRGIPQRDWIFREISVRLSWSRVNYRQRGTRGPLQYQTQRQDGWWALDTVGRRVMTTDYVALSTPPRNAETLTSSARTFAVLVVADREE
ncbi:uncharacterized protein LOC116847579 [Odontomachus brunneus]|uniref:uncharacterized protein LOC116847579 n=1 Tax=Odontomachus brunneus TaxID=486640 RepID=UPI0013F1EFBF|nr:uncharacterized protein LOC116847579 [Odontomachus brunneus]